MGGVMVSFKPHTSNVGTLILCKSLKVIDIDFDKDFPTHQAPLKARVQEALDRHDRVKSFLEFTKWLGENPVYEDLLL